MSTIQRRQTQRNRIMTIHWSWIILIPLLIVNAVMIVDAFMINGAIIDYSLYPQSRIIAIYLILVYVGIMWIYSVSRILYNYFTKGKPVSFN